MNRIIVCCLLSLSSYILVAQDTLTFYYDDKWNEIINKDQAEYYRKAFLVNDVWTVIDYFKSDKIQMTGTFKSKKLTSKHGHFVYYYENSQKQMEGDYFNDKMEGKWSYWYENGLKKSDGIYLAGKFEGKWEFWFETGEKKSQGIFSNNRKDSVWNYWHKNGQIGSVEVFENGLIISDKQFYKDGSLNYSGKYEYGQQSGKWTYWNSDGRIYLSGNYVNGVRDGEWVRSFRDGEIKIYYNKGVISKNDYGGMVRKSRT